MKKIVIVGSSCCGKTTLANKLSNKLNLKHISLDELHWQPGWKSTPASELLPIIKKEMGNEGWIIDGNYKNCRELTWKEADTIIWLDYSFSLVLFRWFKRSVRRILFKEACCNGNYETLRNVFIPKNSLLIWIFKTFLPYRKEYQKVIQNPQYAHIRFLRFTSPKHTENFIN